MSISKLDSITPIQFQKFLEESHDLRDFVSKIGYKQISSDLQERIRKKCQEYHLSEEILNVESSSKKCNECGILKPILEFYGRRAVCKECVRNREKEKYQIKMISLNDYKKTLKCSKCGESRFYLLDFHHINPEQKDYSISDNPHAKLETIMEEIKKCIPLCSNCHREFHYLEKEKQISIDTYLGS